MRHNRVGRARGVIVVGVASVCGLIGSSLMAQTPEEARAAEEQAQYTPDPTVVTRRVLDDQAPFTESWADMVRLAKRRAVNVAEIAEPHVHRAGPIEGGAGVLLGRAGAGTASPPAFVPRGPGTTPFPTLDSTITGTDRYQQVAEFGTTSSPPNVTAAAGLNHVVEIAGYGVAVYNKQGVRQSLVSTASFFNVELGGVTYPRNLAFRGRVVFDHQSGRFFATAIERGDPIGTQMGVMLAVSRTGDPTGLWDKYYLPIGTPTSGGVSWLTDWQHLSVDTRGVIVGAILFPSDGSSAVMRVAAVSRDRLIASTPSLGAVTTFDFSTFGPPLAASLSVSSAGASSLTVLVNSTGLGTVELRTMSWTFSSGNYVPQTPSAPVSFPTPVGIYTAFPPAGGTSFFVQYADPRMQAAVRHGDRIWACRSLVLDATGMQTVDYEAGRFGIEWFEFRVPTLATATFYQTGRVFDPSPSNPVHYMHPSLSVNSQRHLGMAFMGTGESTFFGAYGCGRLETDVLGTMRPVETLRAGEAVFDSPRNTADRVLWGWYSSTQIDPADGTTFWSALPYAASGTANTWRNGIFRRVTRKPPAVASLGINDTLPSSVLVRGADLVLRGQMAPAPDGEDVVRSNFYPRSWLRVGDGTFVTSVGDSAPPAVSTVSGSPSDFSSYVRVASDAPLGVHDVVLVNPDGQVSAAPAGQVQIIDAAVPEDFRDTSPVRTAAQMPLSRTIDASQLFTGPSTYPWRDVFFRLSSGESVGYWTARVEGVPPEHLVTLSVSGDTPSSAYAVSRRMHWQGSGVLQVFISPLGSNAFAGTFTVELDFVPMPAGCGSAPVLSLNNPVSASLLAAPGWPLPVGFPSSDQDCWSRPYQIPQHAAVHAFVPPATGDYVLDLEADFAAELDLGRAISEVCQGGGIRGLGCRLLSWSGGYQFPWGLNRSTVVKLQAGMLYYIVVRPAEYGFGQYTLAVRSMPGVIGVSESEARPIPVPSVQAFDTSQTTGSDRPTVDCDGGPTYTMGHDQWFRFSAPEVGTLGVALRGVERSGVPRLALYRVSTPPCTDCPSGLSLIACGANDTPVGRFTAQLDSGGTFFLQIGQSTAEAARGEVELSFTSDQIHSTSCCLPGRCVHLNETDCRTLGGVTSFGSSCVDSEGPSTTLHTLTLLGAGTTAIPDASASAPGVLTLSAEGPALGGRVVGVRVEIGELLHSAAGDLIVRVLHDGRQLDLINRPARDVGNPNGTDGNLSGAYTFRDSAGATMWGAAGAHTGSSIIPTGSYRPGTIVGLEQSLQWSFGGARLGGTWTVQVEDHRATNAGSIGDVRLVLEYRHVEPASCDGLVSGACCFGDVCVVMPSWDCPGGPWLKKKDDPAAFYPGVTCSVGFCATAALPGACCDMDGLCEVRTLVSCASLDRQFLGGGTGCNPNTCPNAPGACCLASGACVLLHPSPPVCANLGGDYRGQGTVCAPNPCVSLQGACCCGSACTVTLQTACVGPNRMYAGPGTVCNPDSYTVPCCRGDFNKSGSLSVQDIFEFLAAYFSDSPCANTNGSFSGSPNGISVQDIFDFLAAYFAGCN